MRYRIIYLAIHDRDTMHVEAPNAATAVALAQQATGDDPVVFELLSVAPDPDTRSR